MYLKSLDKINISPKELWKSYCELKSVEKVAKKFKIWKVTIRKIFDKNGYILKRYVADQPKTIEKIRKLYSEDGLTMQEISDKLSIRVKRIRKIIRENNIVQKKKLLSKDKINYWKSFLEEQRRLKLASELEKEIIEYNTKYKRCPYCGWKTIDVENNGQSYIRHFLSKHKDIDIFEHIEKYPEDLKYFEKHIDKIKKVKCKVCGKYVSLIDNRHLAKHNMTKEDYIKLYGSDDLISSKTKEKLHDCFEKMMDNDEWKRFSSSYENEIASFLKENNIEFQQHNRDILGHNNELDFYIPSHNLAIEFNGLFYHSDFFENRGKDYHINKTNICNDKGISLIQIFEDEMKFYKGIVFAELTDILGIKRNLIEFDKNKIKIEEINEDIAVDFLNKNSFYIQAKNEIYIGCFYNEILISLIGLNCVNKENNSYKLEIFSYDMEYNAKYTIKDLFDYFIEKYNTTIIESYLDRRWIIDKDNNILTDIGFKFYNIEGPTFYYFNNLYARDKRLSESIINEDNSNGVQFYKIWNCGFFKYIFKP